MITPSLLLRMDIVGYDHQTHEEHRFDVASEALAWGRQRAAAMAALCGLVGPVEEACEAGVLLMGQVMNEAGAAVEAEPLVWVGIDISSSGGGSPRRG